MKNMERFMFLLGSVFDIEDIPDGSGIELDLKEEYYDFCNEVQLAGIDKFLYEIENYVNTSGYAIDDCRWGIRILDQIRSFRN